jgi:hypothetical protein
MTELGANLALAGHSSEEAADRAWTRVDDARVRSSLHRPFGPLVVGDVAAAYLVRVGLSFRRSATGVLLHWRCDLEI